MRLSPTSSPPTTPTAPACCVSSPGCVPQVQRLLHQGSGWPVPRPPARAGTSSATVNLRLSPIRRLAREMSDNGLLDPAVAAAIERVPGVERRCTRIGNWLTREQANEFLNAPRLPHTDRQARSSHPWPCSSVADCDAPSGCPWTWNTSSSARRVGSSRTCLAKVDVPVPSPSPVASRPASISGPVRRASARARYSGPSPRAVR